jgi:DNA invertase Pin-like site-specific DNA recombinase
MNALKPRAPFQVLVMSEESRLGREAIETAYALKQLVQAGVRVFFYLEDRERTLDSSTDKIMMSLTAFANELEREKARQRTYDAMLRKAKAGHVTGGRVFGYDNVDVLNASGKRSHVERRINEAEAAIVRRIFALCTEGVGQQRIARSLNAERATAPRSQQGRPSGWGPSSVHEILFRDLYQGVITWNRTRKRNQWGVQHQAARPAADLVQVQAPQLRIVSEADWIAAHRRLDRSRAQYERDTHGQRRPHRDRDSKYLLPGFGRCALCRGGLHVRSRSHGRRRAFFYACTSHYNCGPEVCPHVEQWPMEAIDREVLAAIAGDVLKPELVDEVVAAAGTMFEASLRSDDRDQRRRDLEAVEREQAAHRRDRGRRRHHDAGAGRAVEGDRNEATRARGTARRRGPSAAHRARLARHRTSDEAKSRGLALDAHGRRGAGADRLPATVDDADHVDAVCREGAPRYSLRRSDRTCRDPWW